jgi:F-type H+-transporting ATPase subunit b
MEGLGINPVLLLAQIISFLMLWFVMNKFLYKYIQKALNERRENIKKIFTDKEELENRIVQLEKEQEEKRKELREYSKKIENEAKLAAEEIKKEIVNKAKYLGEKELDHARERINQDVNTARKTLLKEAVTMASDVTEKIIGEKAKDKDWQKMELNKSLAEMKQ